MSLPQYIQFWLLREQKMLAAEVKPTLPDHRAWVGVYPPRISRNSFLVRYFEVAQELIALDVDIHEDQLENKETIELFDEKELIQVLLRWLEDINDLKGPSFSDYPI